MTRRKHNRAELWDLLARARQAEVIVTCRSVQAAQSLKNALNYEQREQAESNGPRVVVEQRRTRLRLYRSQDPILYAEQRTRSPM